MQVQLILNHVIIKQHFMSKFTSLYELCIHLLYTTWALIQSKGYLSKAYKLAVNIMDVHNHWRQDGQSGHMNWQRWWSPLLWP